MSIYNQWESYAYNEETPKDELQSRWDCYFKQELKIYKYILETTEYPISGTFKELYTRFGVDSLTMIGFLDGISDSLRSCLDVYNVYDDTPIKLDYDMELLYKNMVVAKVDWLYNLEIWDKIYPNRPDPQKRISPLLNTPQYINTDYQVVNKSSKQKAKPVNIPRCPICQSIDLVKITATKKVAKVAVFGIFGAGDIGKTWKCNNCGSKF